MKKGLFLLASLAGFMGFIQGGSATPAPSLSWSHIGPFQLGMSYQAFVAQYPIMGRLAYDEVSEHNNGTYKILPVTERYESGLTTHFTSGYLCPDAEDVIVHHARFADTQFSPELVFHNKKLVSIAQNTEWPLASGNQRIYETMLKTYGPPGTVEGNHYPVDCNGTSGPMKVETTWRRFIWSMGTVQAVAQINETVDPKTCALGKAYWYALKDTALAHDLNACDDAAHNRLFKRSP